MLITKKVSTCTPPEEKSYTQAYQKHEASGFGYKVVCHYGRKYSKPAVIYRGENVIEKFTSQLYHEVDDCKKVIERDFQKPLMMIKEEEKLFQASEKCWICGLKFLEAKTEAENQTHKDKDEDEDLEEEWFCNEFYETHKVKDEDEDEDKYERLCFHYHVHEDWILLQYKFFEKEITEKEKKAKECVRDHCHVTGKYRGAAYRKCNLKLQIRAEKIKIPVIFHNLKGYDSDFIIEKLGEKIKKTDELIQEEVKRTLNNPFLSKETCKETLKKINGKKVDINVTASNTEKYVSFRIGRHLTFIDSFQFMSQSLAILSSNLPDDKYIYTSKVFRGEQLTLMKKKGVYPYDYMDSVEKFKEKNYLVKKIFTVS